METKIIQPIVPNPQYTIDMPKNVTNKYLDIIIKLRNKKEINIKQIITLIKNNYKSAWNIVKYLPYSTIINLYRKYNMFINYWTNEMIEEILSHNEKMFKICIYNNSNFYQYLVLLTNQFDVNFNFMKKNIEKNVPNFEQIFGIKLENYFWGTNLMLYLSNSKLKDQINQFKIYPKRAVRIKNDFIRSNSEVSTMIINKKMLIVDKRIFKNVGQIFMVDDQKIVYGHDGKIWIKPKYYQNINSIEKIDYTFKNLKPFNVCSIYTSKKIRVKNEKIPLCYGYRCKKYYKLYYDNYVEMCLDCGKLNYLKKKEKFDYSGLNIFITGIRKKIGFYTALKALRSNAAYVIGTSRFPASTWYNFSREKDFNVWKDKLLVYKINFLSLKDVSTMIAFLKTKKINIIINNAAQTERPSETYVKNINKLENVLNQNFIENKSNKLIPHQSTKLIKCKDSLFNYPEWTKKDKNLIQTKIEDSKLEFNQFLDIKEVEHETSWYQKFEEINPEEIAEVTVINQLVPTLIINQLLPFLDKNKLRIIINVTADEGKFHGIKTELHGHVNMCKSALNQMIRTFGERKDKNLYFYAVDPGFVSGVNVNKTDYPLHSRDGASRILDPINRCLENKPYPNGTKLKDYQVSEW